ncbi:gigaxonin-like [Sinocyclocheilus anshuiensis]|uniref:Gigaxonin-like n=1 Tax=Sinocyclocheilus anshuiensis TaxID=1608454 RepID=A0A671L6L8_9TELE|nr:PREDICTED: gigaxonin-like [Sinocyclocheilus anshuiensis]
MSDPKRAGADAGSVVSDPQHSQKLLRVLQSFRQDDCFQDAVLVLDGEQIPVQKNILAAASPYIRTKLNYNPPKEDGSVYKIELQGISVTTMRQILEYIFSGEITLSEDTIQDVVQAADLLLLTDLKSLCCQFLESCITAENCIGIRVFSLHYCLHHVYHVATEYLQTHFRDVANTEEFLEQLPDRLCELLSMEKLNVGNEKHVLEAVVRWIAHDIEARRVHMKEVMSAVWVQGLDQSYLQEQMLGDSLMREVIRNCCMESLGGAMQHGEALLAAFKPRGYSECIVTVGGEERTSRRPMAAARCMCPLYDRDRQLWIELKPMNERRVGHGVVSAEGYLFAIGGMNENKTVLSSGEKYDPETNTWTQIPPMMQARQHFAIAVLDGMIYVLGGENEDTEVLLTMEVFDPHCSVWRTRPKMTTVRKFGCCATMKKRLYVMGGGSYGKIYDSVESYDPKTQQWTTVCPLKERRFGAVACGIGQELYVFGGVRNRDADNPESSQMTICKSEFFHDELKRWVLLDDQNLCIQATSSFVYGAVPIGASIYVVGELDTGTSFDYVREFRRSTGTWHPTRPLMPSDLSKTSCAALRIANCKLFRLQLHQGQFRIRVQST